MGIRTLFLSYMKAFVEENGFILIEREQNLKFMAEHNVTIADLKQIILSLEPSDMFDGPEPDRDPRYSENWVVAEFSPKHNGETLYLKLSIRIDAERCKCLSVKLYTDRPEAEK